MATKTADKSNEKKTNVPKNRISKAMTEEVHGVAIQPLNIGHLRLTLKGTSPLVVHDFDEKSRQEMLDKQTKKQQAKVRDTRCPEEEFLNAIYWAEGSRPPQPNINKETGEKTYDIKVVAKALKEGTFVLPASGFKNATISAARNTDMTMTMLRQSIFVNGVDDPDWCVIKSPSIPKMDARICRLPNKTPIERFRPKWEEWSTVIRVDFDKGLLSADAVVNLLTIAGFFVGVFEGRPEKSALGWGRFEVDTIAGTAV